MCGHCSAHREAVDGPVLPINKAMAEITRLRKYEGWAKRAQPLLVDWLESTTPAAFDNEQVTDTEQLLNDWPGGE